MLGCFTASDWSFSLFHRLDGFQFRHAGKWLSILFAESHELHITRPDRFAKLNDLVGRVTAKTSFGGGFAPLQTIAAQVDFIVFYVTILTVGPGDVADSLDVQRLAVIYHQKVRRLRGVT